MAGTAWTLHPALLYEKYGTVLVQFWETAGLDAFFRPIRRLSTSLGGTLNCSIGALRSRKSTAVGLHHCLLEIRSFSEHAAITRADCSLSESSVAPSVSQANGLCLRSDMYAAKREERKQRKQPSRVQAAANATRQEASVEEPFSSGRSSAASDIAPPTVDGRTSNDATLGRFSRSSSQGSSGSVKEPSSKHAPLGAVPLKGQPGCCEAPTRSVPAEPGAGYAWPRPLLPDDSDESPEASVADNTGVLPLFGVRNMPTVHKKDSRRRAPFRPRHSEDDSDSEIEAIELDVLKWMTYESPAESRGESAPPPSLSDEGREIGTAGHLNTPGRFFGQLSSTERLNIESSTVRPAIAYESLSTERCAMTEDFMHITKEHLPQVLIMGQADDNPDGGGGNRNRGLWTTIIEFENQGSSHEATQQSELDLEEKLAAWDPSQENSYALSTPGHLELLDQEVADPRSSQASHQPAALQSRTELTTDHCLNHKLRKALPSATTDLCLYDDLKWIIEEPEKGEPEPVHGKRIERRHQAGTMQRFKRKPAVQMPKATTATSVSFVHPQPQMKALEPFDAQCDSAVPTFTASSTTETQLSCEKPMDTHSIDALQETTERFSVGSRLTSPPSIQAEDGQSQLVEPINESGTSERRTTDTKSKAQLLDDVHSTKTPETASHGLEVSVSGNGIAPLGGFARDGEDREKMEADTPANAHLGAPRKRRKKRRKHRKRKSLQKKQLAKIKKKERDARKEVESESKEEHEGGRPSVVRPLLPRSTAEWPVEWTSGWTLSGIGAGLHPGDFDDDEVQLQDTGDVTIRIRTSTRSKAAMVWPFGPC
ncbi:hypothetical protein V5799_003943 [Amblyomma americanum]|uniref:Uncharacterized protein n=1 Tax=Amblyomma americanum TaxID=6943 RepID=A0AAQ4D7J2_AMBAM